MATQSKSGFVRYDVTTDTHNAYWGFRNGVNGKTIYFDLGDNTRGMTLGEKDAVETMSVYRGFALYGNHDTVVLGQDGSVRQNPMVYRDYTNKVIFFGLDTGTGVVSSSNPYPINKFKIPESQIKYVANTLKTLADGWDIVILTHVPLFPPTNPANASWNCGQVWSMEHYQTFEGVNDLLDLLVNFKSKTPFNYSGSTYTFPTDRPNCHVVGCFAGHIHAHVKCVYRGIPMETFPSNGSDEWDFEEGSLKNHGMYDPYESYIGINFDAHTVNGQKYIEPDDNAFRKYDYSHNTAAKCPYMANATGAYKMNANSSAYPKFYNGVYIGYSSSATGGTSRGMGDHGQRYFSFGRSTPLVGNISATAIMFDDNGLLRYYKSGGDIGDTQAYSEIPNYNTATVTFTTNNGVTWTFRKGLLVSAN